MIYLAAFGKMQRKKENNYVGKCCYGCRFYTPYYTKGYIKYDRSDIGMCSKTRNIVDKHHGREEFSQRCYGRIDRKQAALAALTENLNTLSEIKQILEEDEEEALEAFLKERIEQKKRERKK